MIRPAFFGNLVGHAKILCTVIEAIDCWQSSLPLIPGFQNQFNASHARDAPRAKILVKTPEADKMVVDQNNIIDLVKEICQIIDDGVDILPDLLPGVLPETPRRGLQWVLPLLIKRIVDGIGSIIDIIDGIGFFDIFVFSDGVSNNNRLGITAAAR